MAIIAQEGRGELQAAGADHRSPAQHEGGLRAAVGGGVRVSAETRSVK